MNTTHGILLFDTTPSHAEVYIDSKLLGKTPSLKITDVIEGTYHYVIKKDKITYNNEVYVQPGKITHIHINLITKEKQEKSSNMTKEITHFASPTTNTLPPTDDNESQQKDNNETIETINKNISELVKLISNSNIMRSEKSVPYNSVVTIETATPTRPTNPDAYLTIENVYANNNSRPIKRMNIINNGPGTIFFIQSMPGKQGFSSQEEVLNVGDRRSLDNVYEIRLRTDVPFTTYRLVEGELTSGSLSRNHKNYVENKIVLQSNEVNLSLQILFDTDITQLSVIKPTVAAINYPTCGVCVPPDATSCCFTVDNSFFIRQNPLPAGRTAAFIAALMYGGYDTTQRITDLGLSSIYANIPFMLPFTIPEGFILEGYALTHNFSTDATFRDWIELIPGSETYTLMQSWPISKRGFGFNEQLNINYISTEFLDTTGAPAGGRSFIFTVTNDDAADDMFGFAAIETILRKIS